jgi:hypothetical protein
MPQYPVQPFGAGVPVTARFLMSAYREPMGLQFFNIPARAVLEATVRVTEMDGKRPRQKFRQCPVQGAQRPFGFKGI